MEPKPVAASRQPGYPTRREVLAGAASLALVGLTGGKFLLAETESGRIVVAPIFAHGEGRGATGCVVVSPPVFLSEEEGMQILREELAKHKIELKPGGVLEGVLVPGREARHEFATNEKGEQVEKCTEVDVPNRDKPFDLSGIDSDRRIAVEFVSRKEYDKYRSEDRGADGSYIMSSVTRYEFKPVAERLLSVAEKQGKDHVFLGVFYDPLGRPPKDENEDRKSDMEALKDWVESRKDRDKISKQESEKLLRQQAEDFVAWLKTKKAID
jgi:hypothetical protein